jgi:hypothetical protein
MIEADGSEYNEGQTRFKINPPEWVNFLRQKRENQNCSQRVARAWRETIPQPTPIAPLTRTSSDQIAQAWVIDPWPPSRNPLGTTAIIVERWWATWRERGQKTVKREAMRK